MTKTARALPPSKRDHLRAYLGALTDELFDRGLIRPTDDAATLFDVVKRHLLVEAAKDLGGIFEEVVAPRLVETGVRFIGRGVGRLIFGGGR